MASCVGEVVGGGYFYDRLPGTIDVVSHRDGEIWVDVHGYFG